MQERMKICGTEIKGWMGGKGRKTRMKFPESVKQKIIVTVGIYSEKVYSDQADKLLKL